MPHSAGETALRSLTEWWRDMGVDVDVDLVTSLQAPPAKFTTRAKPSGQTGAQPRRSSANHADKSVSDWVTVANEMAAACPDLAALKVAVEAFEGCPLKAGANKTVVFDGQLDGPVMVIGEGAGGQEDQTGLPFVGKAGQLLDKMLAAIDLDRKTNVFITNVTFWRPPGNRNPEADELAVCRPFVDRMIELVSPSLIISAGGVSAKSLLNTKTGIMKLRGKRFDYETPGGITAPLIPIFHPAYLLRRPQDKSRTWRDLLLIKSML